MADIKIYGRLVNDTPDGTIAKASQVKDDAIGKFQGDINADLSAKSNVVVYTTGTTVYKDNIVSCNGVLYQVLADSTSSEPSADNPHYRMLSAEIVNETGDSETAVMSQKASTGLYGRVEDCSEYIQATTDADGRLIEGITVDGQRFLVKPSNQDEALQKQVEDLNSIAEHHFANVDSALLSADERLTAVEGKTEELSHNENSEFLEVTTDADGKVIEGVMSDGTKFFAGKVQHGGVVTEPAENPEFFEVTTDADGKVLEGIRENGQKYLLRPSNQDVFIQEMVSEIQSMVSDIQDNTRDLSYTDITEYVKVVTDSEDKLLAGIREDGSVYFPKNETYQVGRNPEFAYCILDSDDRVLFGIREDGSVEWYKGIPESIKEGLAACISDSSYSFNDCSGLCKPGYIIVDVDEGEVVDLTVLESSQVKSAVIPCHKGQVFIISGSTNIHSVRNRLYSFVDEDNKLAHKEPSGVVVASGKTVVAPVSGSLIFQPTSDSYRIVACMDEDCNSIIKSVIEKHNAAVLRSYSGQSTKWNRSVCRKRGEQLLNLVWTNLYKIPTLNGEYVSAGTHKGMLYSSTMEYNKTVGFDVSVRTFMTALRNPYSLMYSEVVNQDNSHSAYGIEYHGGSTSGAYYGIMCNTWALYCHGYKTPYNTAEFARIAEEGIFSRVQVNSGIAAEKYDILWQSGHARLISDITRDSDGKPTDILVTENGNGQTHFTLEEFDADLKSRDGLIYRDNKLYENIRYEPSPFVAVDDESIQDYQYNDDIMTFAGDYACFKEGDLLHLHYRKGGYSGIEVYKDDVLVESIMFSENTALITPLSELTDVEGNAMGIRSDASGTSITDGYDIDLTGKNYTYGKYKARLTDGNGRFSDFTYWEMLNISLVKDGSRYRFSSAKGVPVYWCFCNQSISGRVLESIELTARDIALGYVENPFVHEGYPDFKISVQGEYGRVSKTVSVFNK